MRSANVIETLAELGVGDVIIMERVSDLGYRIKPEAPRRRKGVSDGRTHPCRRTSGSCLADSRCDCPAISLGEIGEV
jgi:hypothetical protein